jgi:hypothetical protein
MMFRNGEMMVNAWRTDLERRVYTVNGVEIACPGDWIVTGEDCDVHAVPAAVFRCMYEPVCVDAKAAWERYC